MIPHRRLLAAGLAIPALVVAACGSEETANSWREAPPPASAAPAPPTVPSFVSSPRTKPSPSKTAKPSRSPSAKPSPSPSRDAAHDRGRCEKAEASRYEMDEAADPFEETDATSADAKRAYLQHSKTLSTLAAAGGDAELSAALRKVAAETAKAAKAADPRIPPNESALDNANLNLSGVCYQWFPDS